MVLQWFLFNASKLLSKSKSVDLADLINTAPIKIDDCKEEEVHTVVSMKECFVKAETEKTARLVEQMKADEKAAKDHRVEVYVVLFIEIRSSMVILRIVPKSNYFAVTVR